MSKTEGAHKAIPVSEPALPHLRGARVIARTFGVSRSTVTAWKEAGAPILQVGKSYQASYAELWNWLKNNGHISFFNIP